MSKHTPGPWHVFSIYAQHEVRTPTDTLVAVANDRANARLIAAAPELLSALKAMLTHMGMDEDEWNKPTFDQARAAIAKAEAQPCE